MKTNSVNRWMTRLLAVLLCLIMVLTLLPATEAKADGNDPVYGTDRTEQELASLWSGNSYTEYWDPRGVYQGKTMPQCKQAYHSWESDRHATITDQENDCSHIGIKHQICKECKCLRTIYTKAKGHWHYRWENPIPGPEHHVEPTCVEDGYADYYCADCGIQIREVLPALGHVWKLTSTQRATTTEPGCATYHCVRIVTKVDSNGYHIRGYCDDSYQDYIAIKGSYSIPQLELMRNHNPQYDDRQDRLLIEWINFHDTARGLRYTNISSFDTPKFSSDEKTMTIKGGPLRDKVGRQEVAVVYAESIANCKNLDPYIDVVIDCDWKLDVYLVDFGTRTQESGGEPRRGLRNITVKGRSVNVYLVNSNIGFIDYKDPNNIYSYYYNTCDVKLSLEGFNSHIYMDGATNSALTHAGGTVHCTASVNMPFYDEGNLLNGQLKVVFQPNNPYYPFMLENVDHGVGYINPNYTHKPALELANMTVDALGTPKNGRVQNGVLSGLSGVKLTNCRWTCDTVELNDFSILELNASTVVGSNNNRTVFNVHNRAELNLNGTVNGDVNVYGTNTLRLNDVTLNGSVLAAGVSDDEYELLESGPYEGQHDRPLGNGAHWIYEGAELDLLLSGSNKIRFSQSDDGWYFKPGIMVHNQAIMIVKDDPKQEGVGSLKIEYLDPYDEGYAPQGAATSIGGVPDLENPRRHGYIFIESGILDLKGYSGGAALGGCLPEAKKYTTDLGTEEPNATVAADYDRIEMVTEGGVTTYYGISLTPGFSSNGGCVSILGGVVTAEAEWGAAAIGGAKYGNAGAITIGGTATVNAETNGGGAAIGGGLPVYEDKYVHAGYQLLRIKRGVDDNSVTGIYVYPDNDGKLRYLNSDWYVDSAGIQHQCTAGELCTEPITQMEPDAQSAIYKKMKKYVSGGGSGTLHIAGGCTVNAWADNPMYDERGNLVNRESSFYHTLIDGQNERESLNPGILELYDQYQRYGHYFEYATLNGNNIFTKYYFNRNANNNNAIELYPVDDLRPYDGSYDNGREPGYVIGSATETANRTVGNSFLLASTGGQTASVILGQHADVNGYAKECSWDQFFKPDSHNQAIYYDENGQLVDGNNVHIVVNSIVMLSDTFALRIGHHSTEEDASGYYEIRHDLKKYAYALQGQIDLSLKGGTSNNNGHTATLDLPNGMTLKLRSGSVMNVGANVTINEDLDDEGQFVVETGAVVKGKGMWPRKPADPQNPPTTDQIRSLLDRIVKQNTPTDPEDPTATVPTVVTHLAVIEANGDRMILSGNSADEIHQQMAAVSLDEKYLLCMFSAGDSGFVKTVVKDEQFGTDIITWKLNTYSPDTVISLVENGALVATPGPYMLTNDHLNLTLTENTNTRTVTAMLKSARLSTPEYGVFEGTADEEMELHIAGPGSKTAFSIELSEEQIVNNKCLFTVPKFAGSEFFIKTLSPLRNKCAMRFGGTMNFTTPISDIAGINIKTLQLNYDGGLALGGIDGGGYVKIPDIGGFPVTGSAKLDLNTFAPNRQLSLEVELDTPIFSGAFHGSFKEARGMIWLDTLYAELSVDKGGIPLVPPTTIGYLQGGGLGFSGLADTIAMDSPGTIPLRFQIAAKASILDVVSGWARVSVGPSGFDLDLEDIKVADFPWIKKFGISASLVAGEKKIGGINYWGVDSDMSTYLVIAIPLHDIGYGNSINEDEVVAGLSATGSVGIGSFAGYKKMKDLYGKTWVYFIYQLRASGSLSGSLTIPKGIVGGYLPVSTVNVGNIELGFYAEANATTRVNASEVKETESPANLVRQLAKNADLEFKAAVGAKASAGVGKAKVYVRAVYVLGEKKFDLDYGFGSGGKLDLSGAVNSSVSTPKSYSTTLTGTEMEDCDELVPTIVQTSAYSAAQLDSTSRDASDTVKLESGDGGSINATVNQAMAGNVIVALQLNQKVDGLSAANVTVTSGGNNVALIPDVYDANGESTVANANFCVGTTGTGDDETSTICFVPYEAGTYNIRLTGTTAAIIMGDAIVTTNFATLDTTATSLGDSSLSYLVNDAVENARYKVQVYMGEEVGSADYLLAETEELTDLNSTLDVAFTGNLAASGSYYPVIQLLEYVDATNAAGETIGTWAAVDQINLNEAKAYINNDQIDAPASITLSYAGNGCMSATWDAVTGADYYQVFVSREVANTEWDETAGAYVPTTGTHYEDTGLSFETTETVILMDLSSLYGTPAANQSVQVGVQAVKNVKAMIVNENDGTTEEDTESESQYKTGIMGLSNAATLSKATPPVVTYSDNVVGEGSSYSVTANATGATFKIQSESNLTFTVTNSATGDEIASGTGTLLTVTVPAVTEQTLSTPLILEVKAMNGEGDYALNRIAVNFDTVAPPLVLNNLGQFPKWSFDGGYYAEISGQTETTATVCLYSVQTQESGTVNPTTTFTFLTSVTPNENGSFTIPVQFTDVSTYCIQAVDAVGNKSVALTVDFPESDVVVNIDADSGSCFVSSIGLVNGTAVGSLPTPVIDDDKTVFDCWYLNVDTVEYVKPAHDDNTNNSIGNRRDTDTGTNTNEITTTEVTVTPDMVFTKDEYGKIKVTKPDPVTGTTVLIGTFSTTPVLIARWADNAVTVEYHPGEGAACDVSKTLYKKGDSLGTLPVPRRTDGAVMLFLGWYNGETEYTEDSVVNSKTELTALWANLVTVTFDAGLGNLNLSEAFADDGSIVIPQGSALPELPEATARGYKLDGWYNGENKVKDTDTYSSDTTLTAQWTRKTDDVMVTQQGCTEDQVLPDPEIDWPNLPEGEAWIGDPDISYEGSNYLSTSKPTAPGTYEVVVYRETFDCAYSGRAPFTIAPKNPTFSTGRAMVLSGEIGVKFKVIYPQGYDMSGVTVTYEVSDGRTGTAKAEAINGENAMWFICNINALELADTITATLNYNGGDVSTSYSAMYYIDAARNQFSTNRKVQDMLDALQDYGYYMQASGWSDGQQHRAIAKATTLDANSIEAATTALNGMAFSKTQGDGVADVKYSLTLNAETKLNIFVKPSEGTTILTEGFSAIPNEEGYYIYTTGKIGPKMLGKTITLSVTTSAGNTATTVSVSPMSYVQAILNRPSYTPAQKYAMTAYYNYYAAAANYPN